MASSKRFSAIILMAVAVAATAGCGGEFQLASVSGVVTLDGEALANASLYFQPQRRGDDPLVGPPSIGVTDSEGRFTLTTADGDRGAVVGMHRVSVSTFESRMVDPQNSDRVEVVSEERVPTRYRARTELSFEVPSGGSKDANFALRNS
ncbi:MAG: hypothetical protein AAFV43_16720 [Planctomycetota bacterium]